MKKLFLTTGILSVIVLLSGCVNPPQPPKAYKSAVSNSALEDEKKKEILNKSLYDVTTLAQKSAQISLNPSQNNCFTWDAIPRKDAPLKGSMTSCYTIENDEIVLKQEFKCFARDKAGNEKESNECSFGIVPHTERYVKFVDTVSQYVATAYNENLRVLENDAKDPNKIFLYSSPKLDGVVSLASRTDEFGHSISGGAECKRFAMLKERYKVDKTELLKLSAEAYSVTNFNQGNLNLFGDQAAFKVYMQTGKVPSAITINDASLSSAQNFKNKSITINRDILSIMAAFNRYLGRYGNVAQETYISRMFLVDALFYTQDALEPAILPTCLVGFERANTWDKKGKMDMHHFITATNLMKEKNPKVNKLLFYILNEDYAGASEYLMSDRRIKETYEIMINHYQKIKEQEQ